MELNDNGDFDIFEKVANVTSLVQKIVDTTKKTLQYNEQYYSILFILCSTQLISNSARLKIIRKHKSNAQRKFNAKKRRLSYVNMESTLKKQLLQRAEEYKCTEFAKKEKELSRLRTNSQTWYNSMNCTEKEERLSRMRSHSETWYNSMNDSEKQYRLLDMRNNSQTWYNSMNMSEKQERLSDMRSNSQTLHNMLNPAEKIKRLSNMQAVSQNLRHSRKEKQFDLDYCMKLFQSKIREGPYFICSVCNRLLYRKTVILLQKSKYNIQHLFTGKKSFDEKEYICKTCHSKLLKHQNYHVKLCTIICR